jgi:pimeloyl-ACP methyl ester carboxylesterase
MATRLPLKLDLKLDNLTEATSMALAQQIELAEILTPLSPEPIVTAFVRQGGGPAAPTVLLHGFDSSLLEFRRLLPLLAKQAGQIWALDLFGFGFTARPAGLPFSPESIKTHFYYSWKTLIAEPIILVGASMGGAAAIDFALTYPDAVRQLVLIDSAGLTAGPAMGKLMVPPLGYLATAFLRNLKVRQSISLKAYHDPSYASADALSCAALHLQCQGWQQALIAFTKSGGYGSFRSQLSQLQAPTLIIWGDNDRILGTAAATALQQAIPQSQLVWITACGHVPHLEQPQATAAAIQDFIQSGLIQSGNA